MLNIILACARREHLASFAAGLSSDPGVRLDWAVSGAEAIEKIRAESPDLVIVDSGLADTGALDLVRHIIGVNAMVHTAVLSALPDEQFHEESEGLGVLCRLPLDPDGSDSAALLQRLRDVIPTGSAASR